MTFVSNDQACVSAKKWLELKKYERNSDIMILILINYSVIWNMSNVKVKVSVIGVILVRIFPY